MWALESLADTPFRRPLLVLISTLGAAFLLLAHYFHVNPLYHPATYVVMAAGLLMAFTREPNVIKALGLALATFVLTFIFRYQMVFCLAFSFLLGKAVFGQTFRAWKWLLSSILFFLSIQIVAVWQQMDLLQRNIPWQLLPLLHGSMLAFCIQCSMLPYPLRKDSVSEAMDHYNWNAGSEALQLAGQTRDLYIKVRSQLREHEIGPRSTAELEEYTEKIIHLCYRLFQITQELSNTNIVVMEQQIAQIREKIQTLSDPVARLQYEQILANKEKQREQHQALFTQEERLRAQILNYISALENMRFAYANRNFSSSASGAESIEVFLDIAKARAEEACL